MNKNDLFDLLDISPDDDDGISDEDLFDETFDSESPEGEVELTRTVLKQDDWDKAQGEMLNAKHNLALENKEVADFHSLVYQLNPELAGQCISKRRQQFIETMMESPEYRELHESTRHNLLTSEMATVRIARQYQKLVDKDTAQKTRFSAEKPGQTEEIPQPNGNCLVAVASALSEAQQDVEEIEQMQTALGGGLGGSGSETEQSANIDQIRNTWNRLKLNHRLRAIIERAGAYRRSAQAIQKQKTRHGYDDMIGVELAGDPGRLLSQELALLGDDDLELDLLRRIVENQAMCRLYEGVESKDRGPIVVVIDESGSMSGDKITNAKALALTMAWVAKHQKRWCALVGFAGGTEGTRLVLKPGKWDQLKLLEWLEHFYGGGTVLDVPLVQLPTVYWDEMQAPKGKTDVIIITDAIVHAEDKMVRDFNAWKQRESVRCISIVLNQSAGDMEKVSDEVHVLPNLTVNCEAAASCLGV